MESLLEFLITIQSYYSHLHTVKVHFAKFASKPNFLLLDIYTLPEAIPKNVHLLNLASAEHVPF